MLVANREYVVQHPVATKRAIRAFLKAADLCVQEPERVATYLAAKGYEPRYEIGLEVLKKLPTTGGAKPIQRTPCASMPCACTRWE